MSFLKKEYSKNDRKRRNLHSSGIYDVINIIMGIGVIITAIVIFIDQNKYDKAFAVEFFFACVLNVCMGIKYYHRREIAKTAALFIAGVFMFIMMVISLIALWL